MNRQMQYDKDVETIKDAAETLNSMRILCMHSTHEEFQDIARIIWPIVKSMAHTIVSLEKYEVKDDQAD